ncbi:dipeptidase [Lutibaculum baratangense]|uniref:Microsomal dipeptidase n=1 Tax=Lutibaculum baratangense AMV1 TaxID=631454 RepID=V4RAV3_9HYPH|nr:dipeptidase [Lutibaculum baratangense]ESR22529.1 Microsomal dipeptidase [Lutibaculum baratangense AMV1]
MSSSLHERLVVVDGLIISRWHRPVFEAMHEGGITAANCTCSVWEDFPTTMKAMADWKTRIRENADILTQIYTTDDIRAAKEAGKTGIILGWQNSTGFGDYLPLVQVFHEIGLRIVQLTYNTTNTVGSGCYETTDTGLTDFGRDLVDEMNRVGILVDLSHVGNKTARDAIEHSKRPVAFSHCLPAALKDHPRNKSDEDMRLIAERGGFVGVTFFPPFLNRGIQSTIDDYIDAIEHVMNVAGEDQTGIGTDFTQDQDDAFFEYITRDKGYGRSLTTFGEIVNPEGIRRIEDFPNLTAAMERRGWPEARIEKVMGGNWLSLLDRVWL